MQDFLEKNNRALAAKTFFRDFFVEQSTILLYQIAFAKETDVVIREE